MINEFSNAIPIAVLSPILEPEVDKYRTIFCTNAETKVITGRRYGSSSSSSNSFSSVNNQTATIRCHIIGKHRPHLIRFSDDGPHFVGERMEFVNDGSMTIRSSPIGQFACVSESDDIRKLVWIVAHNEQLSYIPWVQTCTNSEYSRYPSSGQANTFLVRRGIYEFSSSSIGSNQLAFNIVLPEEYYIAISLCGWLPENTITRASVDYDKWYLFPPCEIRPSSSSSSIPSSSSSSPSSSSSSDSSSSSSSSDSSSSSSDSSSSSSDSSSSPSSSSSSDSQSSSSQPSSSSSQPSSSVSSSSTSSGELPCVCLFEWDGAAWNQIYSTCYEPVCPGAISCIAPPGDGTFVGEILGGTCFQL